MLQGAEAEAVISNLNESSLPIHFSENCGDLHIDSHTRTVKVGISSRQWGDAFLPREHLLNDRIEVSAGVSRKNKPSFKLTYVTNFGHNRPTTKYSGVQFGIYEISSESGIYYLGYQKLFVEADILSYGYEGGVISDKNTGQTGLHGAAGLGGKYFLLKQNADYILGQMMFYLSAELVFLF